MNKILIMLIGFSSLLFSEVITVKPTVTYKISGDKELLLNCNKRVDKKSFGFIEYNSEYWDVSDPDYLEDFMDSYCENSKGYKEVKYEDFVAKLDKYYRENGTCCDTYLNMEVKDRFRLTSIDDLQKIKMIGFERYLGHHYDVPISLSAILGEVKNGKIEFTLNYNNYLTIRKTSNIIKYKSNGKVVEIKLDKTPEFKPIKFTNTYDMNEFEECISGKVWVKKYGKMSGDECEWKALETEEI